MIIPGQCFSSPSFRPANFSGSDQGDSSELRTWQCAMVAPALKACCVDSTCSETEIGTAGLSTLGGSEPVIARQMIQGFPATSVMLSSAMF